LSYLIDRRLNGKNKSTVNRQRFLRRYKKHIKQAVADAINKRSITDINSGEKISIPDRDVKEPVFSHGTGGERSTIHPGNKEFVPGDTLPRSSGGGNGSGHQASDGGEGLDDFVFQISHSEFLDFMFEDLELPNLVKRELMGGETFVYRRAGYTTSGTPNQINIVRSLKTANARRIALGSASKKKLKELKQTLLQLESHGTQDHEKIKALEKKIAAIELKLKRIPFIDSFDIKYNLSTKQPLPSSKAVMFCIMDVSGSMDQATKELAKRFFILLYLFLQRNYDHTDVVFIRHHTSAKEVNEEEFFYSRETGGTIVSSALKLMNTIMDERYPVAEWNIYGAQASDGDNWNNDSSTCAALLERSILPQLQYFSYIEITSREPQNLWHQYQLLAQQFPDVFAIQNIADASDIYPVFRQLFARRQS